MYIIHIQKVCISIVKVSDVLSINFVLVSTNCWNWVTMVTTEWLICLLGTSTVEQTIQRYEFIYFIVSNWTKLYNYLVINNELCVITVVSLSLLYRLDFNPQQLLLVLERLFLKIKNLITTDLKMWLDPF